MTMFEQAYEQIQQWSNGLMEEILRPTPAHFRDLDKKYETDLVDEELLTFSQPLAEGEELDILQDTTSVEPVEAEVEVPMTASEAIKSVESFMPSKGMLEEVANSESKMGNDPQTYRKDYHGGIMQVDKVGYEATKDVASHPKLTAKHKQILDTYGIDWSATEWEDLRDPLHSALGARLYLSNIEDEIPDTKKGRAKYWKDKYNTSAGRGSVSHYLDSNK